MMVESHAADLAPWLDQAHYLGLGLRMSCRYSFEVPNYRFVGVKLEKATPMVSTRPSKVFAKASSRSP